MAARVTMAGWVRAVFSMRVDTSFPVKVGLLCSRNGINRLLRERHEPVRQFRDLFS